VTSLALTHRTEHAIRRSAPRVLSILIVGAICLVWLVPTVGLLVSSFRPAADVATTGWWTAFSPPLRFTLDNYERVLDARNLAQSFLNSVLVTVPATILITLVAAFGGFAFAWMRFPLKDWLFMGTVALLIVPLQIGLVPLLRVFNALDLTGTFLGIWLAHAGFGMPFAMYLLRNFFASLPGEMFESAYIDGASPLAAFVRLALPLSVPGLASLVIFQFLWIWNDLLVALVFLGGTRSVAPLTVSVSNLLTSQGEGWQLLTAAAFISMALPLVVFFALQRFFVRGIVAGSVKG
jgi:alpha-glucoside transport system permease protein